MYQMHLVQTSLFAGVKLMKTARLRFVKHLESMPYYSLYMVLSLPGNCAFSLPPGQAQSLGILL